MRAAPPLTFTLRRFGAWRAALLLLALTGCALMALWWLTFAPPRPGWAAGVALAGVSLSLLPLAELQRLRALTLNWDGLQWQLVAEHGQGVTSTGHATVALDFGGWILLRFVTVAGGRPARWSGRGGSSVWIALQRRGLEAEWHAIRCTVYSPVPARPPGVVPTRSPE